jgi:hypothetical protein
MDESQEEVVRHHHLAGQLHRSRCRVAEQLHRRQEGQAADESEATAGYADGTIR